MCKLVDISAETWNKAEVSVISIHENYVNKTVLLLLCIYDVRKRWGGKNLNDLIDKESKGKYGATNISDLKKQQIRKYKIDSARLIKNSKHSIYISEDILIPIIMQSGLSDLKPIKFRSDLGLNQVNLILKKEQSVETPLLKSFSAEKIKLGHKELENEKVRTDMYFSEHKFAVYIDEKGHTDRNQDKGNERQTKIEKHSDCKFFPRINPDKEGFNSFLGISKIQNYITQSNEEKTKEQKEKIKEQENKIKKQKNKFAKELLSYISSISMPLKHIKYFVKKTLLTL